MVRVLFVCLGNICRSPMGEFVMKEAVKNSGESDLFVIQSAGTSDEEEGNPVYPPARQELEKHGISCAGKRAYHLSASDYNRFDYVLCMEQRNVRSTVRIFGSDPDKKVFRLLDFTSNPRDIADPWYTRDFTSAFNEIEEGVTGFLEFLRSKTDLLYN